MDNFLCHVCVFVCITYVRTVDQWLVVLKWEAPDYINSSSINVSSSTNTLSYNIISMNITKISFSLTGRFTSVKELLSSPRTLVIHSQEFLEDGSRQEKWCNCHALKPAGHEGKDSKVETFWKNSRRERGWNKRRRSMKRR